MKTALVTGASSGIGEALVKHLLSKDYQVLAVSRNQDKLDALQKEINNEAFLPLCCDVSDLASVQRVSSKLKEAGKIPHLFFLNAGIAGQAAMEKADLDLKVHENIFAVNYYGVLNFVQEWHKLCSENGGATFVVSSSVNATFAPPYGSAYAASKAAISKAFDGLRITHAGSNLKFLSVFCGPVDTKGLSGKVPFTWHAMKMAVYMVKKAEKGKARAHPSWFYRVVCKLFDILPEKLVMRILKQS